MIRRARLTLRRGWGLLEQNMNITRFAMGPATPQPTLSHLRQTLAEIDSGHALRLLGEERLFKIAAPIDRLRRAA